jgi:hypothetical protein
MATTRSPFPGMDPYLEAHWQGVHAALIVETSRVLNRLLPEDLAARLEERIAIDSGFESERLTNPDEFVYEPGSSYSPADHPAVSIDAPYCLVVDSEPVKQRFVRIISQEGQLITVIEFISPSNKINPGLDAYLQKRSELLAAGTHLVEIDLVRQGNWRALMKPHICPATALSTYRATVRIAGSPRRAYVYPIHFQAALPEIQIPLRPTDPKLMLALQPMIEAIYTDGRYNRTLDYTRPLEPPLAIDEQRYADEALKAVG